MVCVSGAGHWGRVCLLVGAVWVRRGVISWLVFQGLVRVFLFLECS